jgi:uncharacterized repeat protein (TIGR02543 family)
MRKLFSWLFIVFALLAFVGCDKEVTITDIEVIGDEIEFDKNFELSDLKIKITKSDGTVEYIDLNEDMISATDLNKLNTEGRHKITVRYLDNETEFFITITGQKGDDGREVELQADNGYIRWRYKGESTWRNLIALSELKGADGQVGKDGEDGAPGKEVEFNVTTEHIQWRYKGDAEWQNLIALSLLKGEDGAAATISVSTDGYWVINGVKSAYKVVPDVPEPVICTVTLDLDGGNLPDGYADKVEVAKGDSFELPIPKKPGCKFLGWYTGDTINDGQFFNYIPVTQDMTLYARWALALEDLLTGNNYTIDLRGAAYFEYEDGYTGEDAFETLRVFTINGDLFAVVDVFSSETITGYEVYEFEYNLCSYHDEFFWYMLLDSGKESMFDRSDSLYSYSDIIISALTDSSMYTRGSDGLYYYSDPDMFIAEVIEWDPGHVEPLEAQIYYDPASISFLVEVSYIRDDMYFEFLYELTISEIGTTTADLSIDQLKQMVESYLDYLITAFDAEAMTNESYDMLMDTINTVREGLAEVTEFIDVFNIMIDFYNCFSDIDFQYDSLKHLKKDKIEGIEFTLAEKIKTAADECIDDMTELAEGYIEALTALTTSGEVYAKYDEFIDKLIEIYISDPEKVILEAKKIEAIVYLSDIRNAYEDSLKYDLNYPLVNYIISNCQEQIEATVTVEEVENLVNAAINELRDLNLLLYDGALEYYQDYMVDSLWNSFYLYYPFLSGAYVDVCFEVLDAVNSIREAICIIDVTTIFYTADRHINDLLLAYLADELIAELAKGCDYYLMTAVDVSEDEIMALYEKYVAGFGSATEMWDMLILRDQMYQEFDNIPIDALKAMKYNNLKDLYETFAEKVKTAKDTAIVDMEEAYQDGVDAILAAANYEELIIAYYAALDAIDNAYQIDTDKLALQALIQCQIPCVYMWSNQVYNLFDTNNYIQQTVALRVFNEFIEQLQTAQSQIEFYEMFDEFQLMLTRMEFQFDYSEFPDYILVVLGYLDDNYWRLMGNYYGKLPEDFEAEYTAVVERIAESTDYLEVLYEGVCLVMYFNEVEAEIIRTEALDYLDNRYARLQSLVEDWTLAVLEAEYGKTKTLILSSYTRDDIYGYIEDFENRSFPFNELRLAISRALNELAAYYESMRPNLINAELMDNYYNAYSASINSADSIDNVDAMLSQALANLRNFARMDYDKFLLNYTRNIYLDITWYLEMTIKEAVSNYEKYMLTAARMQANELLENADTLEDLELIYNDWLDEVFNLEFVDIQPLDLQNALIDNVLLMLYWQYPNPTAPEFSTVYHDHTVNIRSKDDLKETYAAFVEAYFALKALIEKNYSDAKVPDMYAYWGEMRELVLDILEEYDAHFYAYLDILSEYPYALVADYLFYRVYYLADDIRNGRI